MMTAQTDTSTSYSPYRLAADAEITEVQAILRAAGLLGETKRIAYLGLMDPARNAPEGISRTAGSASSSTTSPAAHPRTPWSP